MTLRARPVARRRGRAGWDAGDRRNSLINLGFFLAIGLSVLILIGYAAWSWYDAHFGAAATVNGQVITKDDLRARLKVEDFRLNYVESRIRTLIAKGRISQADGDQQLQFLQQRRDQLASLSLDRLVDIALMTKLAADNGVTVAEEDIDKQILDEATTTEQRHVWMIVIEPEVDPDTGEVGEDEKAAALIKAQQALGDLQRGESWEDVARKLSDSANAPQAGDLGWLAQESGYDEAFMEAVFAAELNEPTGVVEASDDSYLIGRATESSPEEVDPDFAIAVGEADILMADYRLAVRGDVTRTKLSDKIVADLSKAGPQRHVLQIRVPEPNASTLGEVEPGVKVRWIAYAPKDSMSEAEDLPAEDPAWAEARADAEAAYAILRTNADRFDELARSESDEPSGENNGGKQPWYYDSSNLESVLRLAILDPNDKAGTVLAPVKGEDAWFVIQIMRRSDVTEADFLASLKAQATDEATFRKLARDNSEGEGADEGGDIGWIAKAQLGDDLDKAVFATPVGSVSEVINIDGEAKYLLMILAEETREPTEEQLEIIESSGFSLWYSRLKDEATIDYALGSTPG
jgi:parvulin-like peptidyl-prolyl isomerase